MKTDSRAASTAMVAVLLLAACGERRPAEAAGPERTALQMFELARSERPAEELITGLFGAGLDDRDRAALLESLSALSTLSAVEAAGSEKLQGLDRVVVDISAALPAGGLARYSLQMEQTSQGGWIILWFQGPGVEWPRRARPRGEGLTTSAPPNGDGAP